MNTKQLNEQLYANRELAGTAEHCICEDCVFYAEQIMKNDALVSFLLTKGLNPRKADEVWCYMEKDGNKHYTADFFEMYAEKEEMHIYGNVKVTFYINNYAEKEQPPHACTIDVVFKR